MQAVAVMLLCSKSEILSLNCDKHLHFLLLLLCQLNYLNTELVLTDTVMSSFF